MLKGLSRFKVAKSQPKLVKKPCNITF